MLINVAEKEQLNGTRKNNIRTVVTNYNYYQTMGLNKNIQIFLIDI